MSLTRGNRKRSVLREQSVQRDPRRHLRFLGQGLQWIGSGVLKVSLVLACLAALSVSFLLLYGGLLRSDLLRLEQVEIEGIAGGLRDELLQSCGLNSGVSLLAVNLEELKKAMEAHPWIKEVQLRKRFPHTLIIQAMPERPIALVLSRGFHYLNAQGEIFKRLEEWEKPDLPVITGLPDGEAAISERLKAAAELLEALDRGDGPWSLSALSEIHLGAFNRASLFFKGVPAEIRLPCGRLPGERRRELEALTEKIRGLSQVAEHLTRSGRLEQVTAIDLNYMDSVVVSF